LAADHNVVMKNIFFFFLIFIVTGAATAQENRIILLGKGLENANEDVARKLLDDLKAGPAAVILTGDYLSNRYRINQDFMKASAIGRALASYEGPVFIMPGENEFGPHQVNATEHLSALEQSITDLDSAWQLIPSSSCPGPVTIEINESFLLIFINTARFFHDGAVIPAQECGLEDETAMFAELEDILEENPHRPVFVAGHHPVRSRGLYGGYFPWYQHLLPPVLGSVYAGFRKYIGGLHDIPGDRYQALITELEAVFRKHDGVYYLSGHEGYFHYDIINDVHPRSQVIAGSIGRPSYAKPIKSAEEASIQMSDYIRVSREQGYVLIDVLNISASPLTSKVAVAYRTADDDLVSVSFYNGQIPLRQDGIRDSVYTGQTIDAHATLKLRKESAKPGLLGNNYRDEWEATLQDVPIFDLEEKYGGLEIVKKGGGQQTRSLRLEASDERQYVLRSIEKYPEKAVPINLRNTLAEDIIRDQVSASHPYGAIVVPPLADAAGVYHTNPEIVYLPDDPALGEFREMFAEGLYLFEERPDDDHWEEAAFFGNAPEIMSTADVVEKLGNDDDHFIEEDQVIRSRLFDIWIGDWDRHDDQWRWKRTKDENDIKHYEPIPRDRDQVFFWSDGRLLDIGSRRWGQPKFQGFHEKIRDVAGLSFNARHFDRTFLIESDRQRWMDIARDLQDRLTDAVIENSVRQFPEEIYQLHGADIIRKLKIRRDDLSMYAREYYEFLSRTVTITGSNESERFTITHYPGDSTKVQKFRVKSGTGEIKYLAYERMFKADETDEIRIFGREEDDRFYIQGETDRAPLIRLIGGQGRDSVVNQGIVHKGGKNVVFYDTPDNYLLPGRVTKDRRSDRKQVNYYNRYEFQYDYVMPQVTGGYNPDDGLFLGGGILVRKHGFRKNPYASEHRFLASLAPRSASYNLSYDGDFIDVFGRSDLELNVRIDEPSFGDFFYGFGNQTDFNDSIFEAQRQFYRVRYSQWIVQPLIRFNSSNRKHIFRLGPYYRSVRIRRDENTQITDRFIIAYSEFVGRGAESPMPLLDNRRHYTGIRLAYQLDLRDSEQFTRNGLFWDNEVTLAFQIDDEEFSHQRINSALSFYFTVGEGLRVTFAGRIGGQANFGDFEFYQAARLGGLSNLRGYRKLRFAGDQSFFTNIELRVKVLEFKSFLFPALFGFHLYRDQGRVWSDAPNLPVQNPEKAIWHRGLGAGLWLAPMGTFVVSTDYSRSNDGEDAFYVRLGFFF